jgi:hypothetical protein
VRKLLVALMVVILGAGLVGCGETKKTVEKKTETKSETGPKTP